MRFSMKDYGDLTVSTSPVSTFVDQYLKRTCIYLPKRAEL